MAAIASRYARALVEVVMDQKIDPAAAVQQVNTIVGAIQESADLRKVWEAPDVPAAQKRNLLDAIGKQVGLSRTVRNFFAVLIDHQRVAMLEQIAGNLRSNWMSYSVLPRRRLPARASSATTRSAIWSRELLPSPARRFAPATLPIRSCWAA